MKQLLLKKLSERLEKLMLSKKMSPKELAKKAKISYSSLMPILNGARECGISKLISIANALEVNPDTLLQGMYSSKHSFYSAGEANKPAPKFLAVFISIIRVTYCMLYEVESGKSIDSVLQFPVRCGDEAEYFLTNIISAIEKLSQDFKSEVELKAVAVFTSVQQYGRRINREKIQNKSDHLFAKFIIESDALSNHKAFIGRNNGICVSINDGSIITYSMDEGETLSRLEGYGFPISDNAGNYWIGCEAIKHVVRVKEQKEPCTLISDRLLAIFNDDIDFLCASTMEVTNATYLKASSIVKELMHHQQKSFDIVKKSFDLLYKDIEIIDERTQAKLPIIICGELAYLYESFFPKERLIQLKEQQSTTLLKYGLAQLKAQFNNPHKSVL